MSILGEEELENSMKETLKKLEEMSAEINHTEDYSDEKIFESLGLDLDAMKKMQEENFSDVDNTIKISYKNTSPFEDPIYNHK